MVQIDETGEGELAVLLLQRVAVLFLFRSHLARCDLAPIGLSLSEEDWARARQIPVIAEAWGRLPGARRSALQRVLGSEAELALVELDGKQRRYLVSDLRRLASALSAPLEREAIRAGRLRFVRWARLGAAGMVLLALAWSLSGALEGISGALRKRFGEPNVAFGRPVSTSTQFADIAPALLVDGDKTTLGFHTDTGPDQWVIIDLGGANRISKVVVYNRTDCCQERAVPLRLEVSDDGVDFEKLVDRTEEFDVWTATGLDAKGRYVRLRHLGANYLHLSEVEVYGGALQQTSAGR